ncbi:hypothetical protein EVJ58_g5625 [Rhodofomes roseus]|uniref:Calcineurin-like phosphoesterase domain-containing protein n=1 Tax=Rhodofomes roseus TaxID=34475 RepID=A0A4Y9YAU6_9APHY|nr:hypothetical protein EVJ58_g5625 [Rhodofomes roseus]
MFELKLLLFLLLTYTPDVLAAPSQVPIQVPETNAKRKLQGRFLHITDMHPDPYFKEDASETSACHRRKPKKARPRSGYYGMPYSDCDSPMTLTNFTLDYLDKQWSKEIDFVVCRTSPYMRGGVLTDNPAHPGPNGVTSEFSSIWRNFVPFESYQVFQRGGYFSVEVIPAQLAVISLNTMYFYDSNKAVGGCEDGDPEDPGNLQFDWLEVWLSGHVPPSADNFFPDCHVRYTELSLRYQDTILGHLYGHMNADHFFFLDADHVRSTRNRNVSTSGEPHFGKKKRRALYNTLLKTFDDLPKPKHNGSYDDYGVVNVSPSVVPNPYLPSFRIFTYNTTGSALWTPLGYAQYYLPDLESANKKHAPKVKLEGGMDSRGVARIALRMSGVRAPSAEVRKDIELSGRK